MQLRAIGKALGGKALKEMIRSSFNFGHINFEINISGDVEYGWIFYKTLKFGRGPGWR